MNDDDNVYAFLGVMQLYEDQAKFTKAAIMLKQIYKSLVDNGFTEDQAMELTKSMLQAAIQSVRE